MQFDHLVIGHGDIARRTARLLRDLGRSVVLVGRHVDPADSGAPLQAAMMADLDNPDSLTGLPIASARILYLAPPPLSGQVDSRMRNFCDELSRRLPERPEKLVYISTSGVYGDCGGELVDETRPVNPQTDRARRRVDAETVLREWCEVNHVSLIVLRVSGIYGPGRLPLQRLSDGMPVLQPELAPSSNRIHADDLAQICLAALDQSKATGIYNVCDGEQSTMSDYFLAVAEVFGLPEPTRVSLEEAQQHFSAEMLSYLGESRRLDNRRLLEKLNITLQYPTMKQGLRAIMQSCDESCA